MGRRASFTKLEREYLPGFRHEMNRIQSCEAARRLFQATATEIVARAVGSDVDVGTEEIELAPEADPPFLISPRLLALAAFQQAWEQSDLRNIVARLAITAAHHCDRRRRQPRAVTARARAW